MDEDVQAEGTVYALCVRCVRCVRCVCVRDVCVCVCVWQVLQFRLHLFSYFFSPSPFLLPLFPSSPLPPLPLSTSLISPLSFLSHLTENALREGFPSHAPVVMYQLRKEYPGSLGKPPHVAVHSVSLAIQRNECFGLLGPNGITAHSHSSSIVASFPFLFHCGLIPIPLPLWSRSHSVMVPVLFLFIPIPNAIILEVFLLF